MLVNNVRARGQSLHIEMGPLAADGLTVTVTIWLQTCLCFLEIL